MRISLKRAAVLGTVLAFCGCGQRGGYEKVPAIEQDVKSANRLIDQTSPYLLQHAHNPVDWYPWGEEAFEAARQRDKPIFLSIGYSSCHWCHVMERESFEDQATADVLNDNFICIKMDREERPDIDAIYMSAVVAMTGSGGWPLNVFLTHDLKPFFGGTYFPPDNRRGGTPFKLVLKHIAEAWKLRRDEIAKAADELTGAIESMHGSENYAGAVEGEAADAAVAMLYTSFDSKEGGFGGAPKFPQPAIMSFLLRYYVRTGEERALEMVTTTLDKMAAGGIFDHLGGGFHRYAVDSEWLVPHFEKMLYDNALLAKVYLEAYQVTDNPVYARTARMTLDYLIRDMTDTSGAFHAAEDADSEGVEGKFYVWGADEIDSLLGEDASAFSEYYGVSEAGNFEGANILNIAAHGPEHRDFDKARQRLLNARGKRARPGRDYKVISAWNGLMISALVKGYEVLDEARYLGAALQAASFIRDTMTQGDVLFRTYAKFETGAPGFLDDYAFMGNAYLDLYEGTGDTQWLIESAKLGSHMLERFGDKDGGGLFFTSGKDSSVLLRRKDYIDNALPSGNSAAVLMLHRLSQITSSVGYASEAQSIIADAAGAISARPTTHINMISAALLAKGDPVEVVVVGRKGAADTETLATAVRRRFLPNATVIVADSSAKDFPALQAKIPLLQGRGMIEGQAAAYVCVNRTCSRPVTSLVNLEKELDRINPAGGSK